MRLFLVRHAHADAGEPDEIRPLSVKGREQARELAERLAAARPELVLTSPLLRARETAAAIARAAAADVRVDERLAPGASAGDVLVALENERDTPVVVAVGHQPDCSEIAFALGAGQVDFPPGGVAEIELP